MAVNFGSGTTQIDNRWTAFKALFNNKSLAPVLQYVDDGVVYSIFAFDGPTALTCTIYKGTVPDGITGVYPQATNDADKADFEANYKPNANAKIALPVSAAATSSTIFNAGTITATGSTVVSGLGVKDLSLLINIKNAPTGTTPSVTFSVQDIDPIDVTTVMGTATAGTAMTVAGAEEVSYTAVSSAVKVTWTVTGTTPSFTGVNVTLAQKVAASSSSSAAASDVTGSGALGALNAAVQVATAGLNTVGFQLAAGTLIGTLVTEVSFDGGTTWVATYFDTMTSGKVSTLVFSSANTATAATLVGVGGAGLSRVRVSLYTSGTANVTVRATTRDDPSVLFAAPSGAVTPPDAAWVAGYNGANLVPLRVDRIGNIRPGFDNIQLQEGMEDNSLNSFTWQELTSGMTISSATGVTTLNNGSSLTALAYAILKSNRKFQFGPGGSMRAIFVANLSNQTSVQLDLGFGGVTSTDTPAGAWFSVDFAGLLTANLKCTGGNRLTSATIPVTLGLFSYLVFTIDLNDQGARFTIETQAGVRLSDVTMSQNSAGLGNGPPNWGFTHQSVFVRVLNELTPTPTTAGMILLYYVSVIGTDLGGEKPWADQLAGVGRFSNLDPGTFTQTLQLAAGAAPASKTPANTTVGYTTLGGEFLLTSTASSENLLGVFGYVIPSPYTFYITEIYLPPYFVSTAMGATTPNVHEWAIMSASSSNPSTATGLRYPLGMYSTIAAATAGTLFTGASLDRTFRTPIVLYPGQTLLVLVKVVSGTATGAYRGSIFINGYFE